jgi:hypothetical protein
MVAAPHDYVVKTHVKVWSYGHLINKTTPKPGERAFNRHTIVEEEMGK